MSRLIALILIFYIGFIVTRFLMRLLGGKWLRKITRQQKKPQAPPWEGEDIEDAEYEDIK